MLVRIIEEKRDFVKKLRNLYAELNSSSEPNQPIPDDLRENLDRLTDEISTADHTLARWVRLTIMNIEFFLIFFKLQQEIGKIFFENATQLKFLNFF